VSEQPRSADRGAHHEGRIIAGALILAGCSTSEPVYTATGSIGHAIDCSGLAQTWDACFAKAGALCGAKGYTVLSQTGERETALVAGGWRAGRLHQPERGRTQHGRQLQGVTPPHSASPVERETPSSKLSARGFASIRREPKALRRLRDPPQSCTRF